MRLDGLDVYMSGLAVHLCYKFRTEFKIWAELDRAEQNIWIDEAYKLVEYLKKQKGKYATRTAKR